MYRGLTGLLAIVLAALIVTGCGSRRRFVSALERGQYKLVVSASRGDIVVPREDGGLGTRSWLVDKPWFADRLDEHDPKGLVARLTSSAAGSVLVNTDIRGRSLLEKVYPKQDASQCPLVLRSISTGKAKAVLEIGMQTEARLAPDATAVATWQAEWDHDTKAWSSFIRVVELRKPKVSCSANLLGLLRGNWHVAPGSRVSWCPESRFLAAEVRRQDGPSNVGIFSRNGKIARIVAKGECPSWHPNGIHLYFFRRRTAWAYSLSGDGLVACRNFRVPAGRKLHAAWHPQGRWLAVTTFLKASIWRHLFSPTDAALGYWDRRDVQMCDTETGQVHRVDGATTVLGWVSSANCKAEERSTPKPASAP